MPETLYISNSWKVHIWANICWYDFNKLYFILNQLVQIHCSYIEIVILWSQLQRHFFYFMSAALLYGKNIKKVLFLLICNENESTKEWKWRNCFYLIYVLNFVIYSKIFACMQIVELIKSVTIFVYDEGWEFLQIVWLV